MLGLSRWGILYTGVGVEHACRNSVDRYSKFDWDGLSKQGLDRHGVNPIANEGSTNFNADAYG